MPPPILLNFGFFVLTSIMNGGLNTYLVVALGALHGTPAAVGSVDGTTEGLGGGSTLAGEMACATAAVTGKAKKLM